MVDSLVFSARILLHGGRALFAQQIQDLPEPFFCQHGCHFFAPRLDLVFSVL